MIRGIDMKINNEYQELLIKRYRIPLFEKDNVDFKEIDALISDQDLVLMIQINNDEMRNIINENNIDIPKLEQLLKENINLYRLADYRKISVSGKSLMMSVATVLNYKLNKTFEIVNNNMYKTLKTK